MGYDLGHCCKIWEGLCREAPPCLQAHCQASWPPRSPSRCRHLWPQDGWEGAFSGLSLNQPYAFTTSCVRLALAHLIFMRLPRET